MIGPSPNRRGIISLPGATSGFAAGLLLLASVANAAPVRAQNSVAPSAPPAPASASTPSATPTPASSAPTPVSPAKSAAPMFSTGARAAAESDPVLQGMIAEIERSKDHLKMEGVQTPYFIEYRVADVTGDAINAIFGATQFNQHTRARILRVVVRIGDYKRDSYFRNGIGVADFAPYENDILALRQQLWEATDRAYKSAGEAFAAKKSLEKQVTLDATIGDFAPASSALVAVEPMATVGADAENYRKAIEDASALYRQFPDVQSVSASLKLTAMNQYYVNTEGTVTRRGWTYYSVGMSAFTQAPDGMTLARSPATMVADAKELPTPEKVVADAKEALQSLQNLRNAPIVDEDYRGPVLFDADAAADVFSDLVGSNILGNKPEPGATARTTGDFASNYKSRVLPDFIDVIDDPTQTSFEAHSVIGHYAFDDEGVKAAPLTVVDKGILVNYLIGRAPIRDFPASNGHGRAGLGGPATPAMGTLILHSRNTMPLADLKKKLIEMCRDQGKPYGYYVATLGEDLTPRLLYRVYVNDAHEELVRGAVFNELDTRAIRGDLIATGDKPLVRNREGNVATTVITPAWLFGELEVKRADTTKDKLPEYPPPPIAPPPAPSH